MPTSAAGNKPAMRLWPAAPAVRPRGFTLIELMVVLALIGLATAGVMLSLRNSAMDALERDAQRLAAVLESARAQSRASGVAAIWQARGDGHVLQGLPLDRPPQRWLSEQTRAEPGPAVVLGPEPLLAPQQIALYSAGAPDTRLWVASDGLRPFEVRREPLRTSP